MAVSNPDAGPEFDANDRPWYAMWARDWLSSAAINAMRPEQEGAYIRLLNIAWLAEPTCTITSDDTALAQLSRLGRRWRTLGPLVKAQFELIDDGRRMRNRRQYEVFREMVEQHDRRVRAGRLGGLARAERGRAPSNAQAMLEHCQSSGQALLKHAYTDTDTTPPHTPERGVRERPKHRLEEPAGFEEAWNAYPRREGNNSRRDAARAYAARLREGVTGADLLAGVHRYRAFCEAKGWVGGPYVKLASTFFGPGQHYAEPWTVAAHPADDSRHVMEPEEYDAYRAEEDAHARAEQARRDAERAGVHA